MKDLSRLSAALMLILGLAACGQDSTTDSPIRQADQATEEAAGTTSGMAQEAMDAASELVGGDVKETVTGMTDEAMDQARSAAGEAVDQARDMAGDMAGDAAAKVMDDPEAAAKALKDRF